jgi:hypothetical protein
VLALVKKGVTRGTLLRWGVEAGYSESFVRGVLSKVWVGLGARVRKRGAGPRVPQEALAIRAYVRGQYGDKAAKFLLAAYRLEKRETQSEQAQKSAA